MLSADEKNGRKEEGAAFEEEENAETTPPVLLRESRIRKPSAIIVDFVVFTAAHQGTSLLSRLLLAFSVSSIFFLQRYK